MKAKTERNARRIAQPVRNSHEIMDDAIKASMTTMPPWVLAKRTKGVTVFPAGKSGISPQDAGTGQHARAAGHTAEPG